MTRFVTDCETANLVNNFTMYAKKGILHNKIQCKVTVRGREDCLRYCSTFNTTRSCDVFGHYDWPLNCCAQDVAWLDVPQSYHKYCGQTHYQRHCA